MAKGNFGDFPALANHIRKTHFQSEMAQRLVITALLRPKVVLCQIPLFCINVFEMDRIVQNSPSTNLHKEIQPA